MAKITENLQRKSNNMTYTHLQDYFYKIYIETNRLVIYRGLLQDHIIDNVRRLLLSCSQDKHHSMETQSCLYDTVSLLMEAAEKEGFKGNAWKHYLLYQVATSENILSRAAEKNGSNILGSSVHKAAIFDIQILKRFSQLSLQAISKVMGLKDIPLPDHFNPMNSSNGNAGKHFWEQFSTLKQGFTDDSRPEELVNTLAQFYEAVGSGRMGIHTAFRWIKGKGLCGVEYPDPVTLNDLIGYKKQKETVTQNTEAFIRGKTANNLLLYGERGTGKSSTIKALANEYCHRGLRLVEVAKHQLPEFPSILRDLRNRAQYFIIFIDDLSFESYETEFKYMKALLEGGLEVKPDNVLIYATSNRRHLVQENWSDREGQDGEIHILDSVQEKLSLADRFGITVTYTAPGQDEYLEIVAGLAKSHGVSLPADKLREMALQWERWHNTRSGRTARQFINHLLGTEAES
ncbi:MAG: ATP-binding protein [Firmicutes bacterium]|nr:ATP-binding protein [Bacillota bacterium]